MSLFLPNFTVHKSLCLVTLKLDLNKRTTVVLLKAILASPNRKPRNVTMDTCRDRLGVFNSSVFNVYACAMCYQYLIAPEDASYVVVSQAPYQGAMLPIAALPDDLDTDLPSGSFVYPDLNDSRSMSVICSSLTVSLDPRSLA